MCQLGRVASSVNLRDLQMCVHTEILAQVRPLARLLVLTKKAAPVRLPEIPGRRWNREECVLGWGCKFCVHVRAMSPVHLWPARTSKLTFPTSVNKATTAGVGSRHEGRGGLRPLKPRPQWNRPGGVNICFRYQSWPCFYMKKQLYWRKLVRDSRRCQDAEDALALIQFLIYLNVHCFNSNDMTCT